MAAYPLLFVVFILRLHNPSDVHRYGRIEPTALESSGFSASALTCRFVIVMKLSLSLLCLI